MTLVINDLVHDEELDSQAMRTVFGGSRSFGGGGFQLVPGYSGSMLGESVNSVSRARQGIVDAYASQFYTGSGAFRPERPRMRGRYAGYFASSRR